MKNLAFKSAVISVAALVATMIGYARNNIAEEIPMKQQDEIRYICIDSKPEPKKDYMELPECDTNMFTYMSYTALSKNSDQYKYTTICGVSEEGILCYECGDRKYYAVALGSFYASKLGDSFHVTLENGTEFDMFVCDFKNDIHTDRRNMGTYIRNYDNETAMNVIEFVIDKNYTSNSVLRAGTFTALEKFGGLCGDGGNIKSIEREGNLNVFQDQ